VSDPDLHPGGTVELGRLHPLSPFVHGWKWFVGVLIVVAPRGLDATDARFGAVVAALALPVAATYGYLAWRFTRYGFDGGDFRLDRGLFFRRSRRVRLDRLQAVDVVRPLIARALGLAELRLEVAGGSSEAPLAYLSERDAHRLRAELLARAAGLAEDVPEAPEQVLHRVPVQRLVVSGLLSTVVLIGLVVVPLLSIAAFIADGPVALLVALSAMATLVGPPVRHIMTNFDFTAAESPDGLRLRRGLLETRAQTVPPGRVQAIRIVEPWLWRRFTDWVSIEVTVAGYAGGESSEQSGVLLPVAPRAEALALLARVLPGVDLVAIELHGVPRRARWLDPMAWRRLALGADGQFVVARRGLLRHETDIVMHVRAQSVRWRQGPWQRRLGLADVHVDTTPGPVHLVASHRDATEAVEAVLREVELARAARAGAGPDRWMVRPSG
jgi:putative membrane protein